MSASVIVSVTALGSRSGAAVAARAAVAYLTAPDAGRAPAHEGPQSERSPGSYYADSVEGPGVWFGAGFAGAMPTGAVSALGLERLLLGQDPRSGRQLIHRPPRPSRRDANVDAIGDHVLTASQAAKVLGVSARYVRGCAQRSLAWDAAATPDGRDRPSDYLAGVRGEGANGGWRFERAEIERFGSARTRVPETVGFDVTFSTPKSVSVLWAIAGPQLETELLAGIDAAVHAGMAYLERQAIGVRLPRGVTARGDGLVAAGYLHATNRNLDPQLHWHVVVGNMTAGPDGRVRALDGRQLFLHAKTAGFVASAELRHQLSRRLGVGWGEVVHGIAEIAGVPQDVIALASTRAAQIERLTGELGVGGATARQIAAYRTRPGKDPGVDPSVLRERWADQFGALGFTLNYVTERVLNREPQVPSIEPQTVEQWFRHLGSAHGVTEQTATFDRRHVVQAVAELARNGSSATEIEALADQWLTSPAAQVLGDISHRDGRPRIVRTDGRVVRTPAGLATYSTPALLALEHEILDTVARGMSAGRALVDTAVVDQAIVEHEHATGGHLGQDQRNMVRTTCGSGDAVACVLGAAGSGKTYALAAAVRAWRTAGFVVWGAAVNGTAAEQLGKATGLDARTLASLLDRLDLSPTPLLTDRHVIVVDEASTVGTRDLARLLRNSERAGAAVRLVGDPAQHSSVEAGGMFRVLVERHTDRTPALTVLRRQQGPATADLRLALADYREGRIAAAWQRLTDNTRIVTAASAPELLDALCADWYVDRLRHHSDPTRVPRTSMIAENHLERRALNARARALLRADATLSGDDIHIGGQHFAVGDEVICRTPAHELHPTREPERYLRNGTRGTITAINHSHNGERSLVVDFDERGPIVVPESFLTRTVRHRIVGGLTHAYALTSHAAQGETFHAGRMLATQEATRPGIYVGLSRGITDARLYVVHADDVHPPRGPDDTLPVLRDTTRAEDALARRLEAAGPERPATELDDRALTVARLRHQHDLATLDTLAATGNVLARQAAAATGAEIAQHAINDPHPAIVDRLGPRPWRPNHRRVWDRAVGELAIGWARGHDGPIDTAFGWHLPTTDPALTLAVHDATVNHLADTAHPAELIDELATWQEHLTGRPTARDLTAAETRAARRGATGGVADEPSLSELRQQVADDEPVRQRVWAIDDALAVHVRHAVETPADYLIDLLGPRQDATDDDRWHRQASDIERYRHQHLGLAPDDGPIAGHVDDPLAAAVGSRPVDERHLRTWLDVTRQHQANDLTITR